MTEFLEVRFGSVILRWGVVNVYEDDDYGQAVKQEEEIMWEVRRLSDNVVS